MAFAISPPYKAKILQQFDTNMAGYPAKKAEVLAFLQGKEETLCLCVKYLYGHMVAQDILSFPAQLMADYAAASLQAYARIDYIKTIPQEIFFPYVLYHRVNSECLDGSRSKLMSEILPFVEGKTMEQAALAVNYCCFAHATYAPADDRTLGPLAIMRRTVGRCGEESVLAVAALRSVGIPARQCYCPRWSHCDDNHAWVEIWIDGDWHYLGACEPEPTLDRGWFTAAASRAMRVDTKCWSTLTSSASPYTPVNCTARYADTKLLTVTVLQNRKPLAGVCVKFQIVNYSELYTLYQMDTDANGIAQLETGLGDLCVYVQHDGKICLHRVDMRVQDSLTVELSEGYRVGTLPETMVMDLVPPTEHTEMSAATDNPVHLDHLRQCEAHRAAYQQTFSQEEGYLRSAAGNWQQIAQFLAHDGYTMAQKEELLGTLRPKDLADITCQTLLDALDTAQAARGRYPADIFRDCILSPRIADEMLLPQRGKIRRLFAQGFTDPAQILRWMEENMQRMEDHGVDQFYPSAYECLFYRQVPAFSFDMVFVALCRAFCLPARLAPDTREGQWLDHSGTWRSIHTCDTNTVTLTLNNPAEKTLHYFEHFTLGRWNGKEYQTLQHAGLTVEKSHSFSLRPGYYRLISTTRQIDGTASVLLRHLHITEKLSITLTCPESQTAQRLTQTPLRLPNGAVQAALEETSGSGRILIFAEPGGEPTEHLFQELLQCAQGFQALDCAIRIFVKNQGGMENATLRQVERSLSNVRAQYCQDTEAEMALHHMMQTGDLRFPFVVCVDRCGYGVYAAANYQIRMAQTLLEIQTLLKNGSMG